MEQTFDRDLDLDEDFVVSQKGFVFDRVPFHMIASENDKETESAISILSVIFEYSKRKKND
jgi:hypothetical protein